MYIIYHILCVIDPKECKHAIHICICEIIYGNDGHTTIFSETLQNDIVKNPNLLIDIKC